MRITKCDLCKKKIEGKAINAGLGFYESIELCRECGLPILKFLKKHKIIKEEKIKIIKS